MANICNTTYKIYDRVDGATARLFYVLKIFFDSGDIPLDELEWKEELIEKMR